MINCLIIDDEEAGRFFVRKKLETFYPKIRHVYEAETLNEAQTIIKQIPIDLVFLDIQLKGVSGFDLLTRNPNRNFKVIFITAYDEFALKAIQEDTVYYILKPIQNDEFKKGVDKALALISELKDAEDYMVYINTVNRVEAIPYDDIYFVQSSGSYSSFQLEDRVIVSTKNLGYFEKILPKNIFLRNHHSYIVNIKKIKRIEKTRTGEILLKNGQRIPVSQRKLGSVVEELQLK